MHGRRRVTSRLALVFALVPALAIAQRTTTGTISGKIIDSSGAVVPGVTLTVSSPEALGQFTVVGDADPRFTVCAQVLATIEAEAADVSEAAHALALVGCAVCLGSIFDHASK